jgi:hypothetical protein
MNIGEQESTTAYDRSAAEVINNPILRYSKSGTGDTFLDGSVYACIPPVPYTHTYVTRSPSLSSPLMRQTLIRL